MSTTNAVQLPASIPETLAYAREVGEAGGTLTLEYDDGLVTLTGPELLEAVEDAEDQDTTEVFTVMGRVTN